LEGIGSKLGRFFPAAEGYGPITSLNYTDGVRVQFCNGDVVHFRPSGNADEFRFYAYADTPERAEALVQAGVAEPHGVLRSMEKELDGILGRASSPVE
jgi:phosphomannomutase